MKTHLSSLDDFSSFTLCLVWSACIVTNLTKSTTLHAGSAQNWDVNSQWCTAKNRGGYPLETRRRYIITYAVLLWQMRWVYTVKKHQRLVYCVYPRIPPINPCQQHARDSNRHKKENTGKKWKRLETGQTCTKFQLTFWLWCDSRLRSLTSTCLRSFRSESLSLSLFLRRSLSRSVPSRSSRCLLRSDLSDFPAADSSSRFRCLFCSRSSPSFFDDRRWSLSRSGFDSLRSSSWRQQQQQPCYMVAVST